MNNNDFLNAFADAVADKLNTPPVGPITYGRKDMARLLHCSTRTVDRFVRLGSIPKPRRIGRSLIWTEEDVAQILSPEGA